LNKIADERARYLPSETGGFLIGLRRGLHLEVIDLTLQHSDDIATPISFRRESLGHAEKVEREWTLSEGLRAIVGDWHSHPIGQGEPSSTDLRAWKVLARACKGSVVGIIAASVEPQVFWVIPRMMSLRTVQLCIVEDGDIDVTYGITGGD
jgi:integrative and conjugative element protein (TIGR02256 family)